MKKLNITWEGINDTTGYLFSFAKSLSAAVKNSPYHELSDDIIATSGFAFRMWVAADLCPSATSIWAFNQQKPWVENGGLLCDYIERMWGQDGIEEERRLAAISMIKKSIDNGIAAICWDIEVPEWGLVVGYDDSMQKLYTLSITGVEGELAYDQIGKGEIPILNVLTIIGKSDKSLETIISDTFKLAVNHLSGQEWCDNSKGLAAYHTLINFFEIEDKEYATCWNMEYYLGTYAALKWYTWKYFEKYDLNQLAELYKTVFESWQKAFELKKTRDLAINENRYEIIQLLKTAEMCENAAVKLL